MSPDDRDYFDGPMESDRKQQSSVTPITLIVLGVLLVGSGYMIWKQQADIKALRQAQIAAAVPATMTPAKPATPAPTPSVLIKPADVFLRYQTQANNFHTDPNNAEIVTACERRGGKWTLLVNVGQNQAVVMCQLPVVKP